MNRIILCFLIVGNSIILFAQSPKTCKGVNKQYNVKELLIKDSTLVTVLNKVLELESKNNKYYTPSVSYSIRVYNRDGGKIIKIEGSDNQGIFIEQKELIGFFEYQMHKFFLLTACNELFIVTNKLKELKIENLRDVAEDDRWPIYYFGYDESNFYYYKCVNCNDTLHLSSGKGIN